ncbi:hypothetical protein RSOLAG1IB_10940 [Rhizoctonia solani AG-1 IB]|uniref:Uncharacterized protein n=1 Tax=Thanatephorus cucumeris (strain AG1-IB / isolate 7/3/14) TaxID=1108050 RepID=A0A0B7G633_THACB|nr:hypothetical protein RSOLAG1IB_10940 [Rhizoctonia solani AG-1 IB]
MASVSTIDISDKYGPKLAVYLNEGGFNRPRDLATSLTGIHIADALKSLAEPERVTFRTFETLMALEWSPVCDHADLLVGDDSKVFPLCFNLLKLLCFHDKKKILEYAYGFMCLQFVAFTVEIGKIAQGGRLLTFQEEIAQLLPDHSIRYILNNYARELEGEGIWNNLGNADKFVGFLGWDWGRDGYRACLPQIGGCLLTQTMPILRQLYIERKSFLSIARQAAGMFPGWGGLLYVLWNTVFENHGGQDNQKLGKKEDQDINWNCIFEIGLRYAMCSKIEEDPLIYIIINNGDLRLYLTDPDHFSPVDIEDSNQVATCATQKLDSMANINDMNNMATGILIPGETSAPTNQPTDLELCTWIDPSPLTDSRTHHN